MKLLKKQKGLPFLLTLGILFILSASFLAVQLWSDKDSFRGALHALEAPVMPPAMPKVVAPPPVKKVTPKGEIPSESVLAKVEVAQPVEKKAPITEPTTVVADTVPTIDKAVLKKEEPPRTVNVKEAAPVAKPSRPARPVEIQPAKEEQVNKVAASENAPVKEKQVAKPRKSRKKAKVEEVPTEIPAEWNWFSKPLKLNLEPGKAQITLAESDREIKLNESEKIATAMVEATEQLAKPVADKVETHDVTTVIASEAIIAEPQTVRPFMMALAKMARIRQMRHTAVTVESRPAVESLSPSMQRLGVALKAICDRVESRVSPEQTSAEGLSDKSGVLVVSEEAETIDQNPSEVLSDVDTTEQTVEPTVEPVRPYGGSGSSFSQRVNALLRSGLIKAD